MCLQAVLQDSLVMINSALGFNATNAAHLSSICRRVWFTTILQSELVEKVSLATLR